ncbi:MAG: GGIII-like transmembrane region-containing protein [Candidatus Thorarchaeota archaeon]
MTNFPFRLVKPFENLLPWLIAGAAGVIVVLIVFIFFRKRKAS